MPKRNALKARARAAHGSNGAGGAVARRLPPMRARVTQEIGSDPLALLAQALVAGDFWAHLERAVRTSRRSRAALRILIKPDLDWYSATSTGTDPLLVEHLIDLLHDQGFTNVAIGDGRNDDDWWLYNREPLVLPELVGYRFHTSKGRDYEVLDLTVNAATSSPEAALSSAISDVWRTADYRISFAKNRTHEDCVFALCVRNLLGVTRRADAQGVELHERVVSVLRQAPPHFNLIDAFISGHGGGGQRAAQAIHTHAFVTSESALLADWVGAAKMGVDPYASPINANALRAIGLPAHYDIDGDLTPYALWRNVHPLVAHSARRRASSGLVGSLSASWFQGVDRERFPLRDFYNERINAYLSRLMSEVDVNPRSRFAVVLANLALAKLDTLITAHRTLFAKDKLARRRAQLTVDPTAFEDAAYDALPQLLAPFERLASSGPANATGLRLRWLDGAVLLACEYVFPVRFDEFVRKVDIANAIQYLNDYIGGCTHVSSRDGAGRSVRQLERNLYLQQPNWLALLGGDVIDVEKLERMHYTRDEHGMCWRTINSPNSSAHHDDGSVRFVRSDRGRSTTVRIFARQQFALPLLFQIVDVHKLPELRDPIVEGAYTTFLRGTVANLQAAYEGRDFRIGHEAKEHDDDGSNVHKLLATAIAAIAELLRQRGSLGDFAQLILGSGRVSEAPATATQDERGFRHFAGVPNGTRHGTDGNGHLATVAQVTALAKEVPGYFAELAAAARDDFERMGSKQSSG